MDVSQLRTFLAAATSGSFAAAAEQVNASTSAVTERIATLESHLGARLFDRSRKGCRLTDAGARFLPRAQSIVSIWELSRGEARVPSRYTAHARIGGQYALWPHLLQPWIGELQRERPELALSLTAGASARLNRDLAGEVLDLTVLYSPVIGPGVETRLVYSDSLVMVRAADCADWRGRLIAIDWGEAMRAPIAQALIDSGVRQEDEEASRGLLLDLGAMAWRWLIDRCAAGYAPERLVEAELAAGRLVRVEEMPRFDYPAYAVWRSRGGLDVAELVASLGRFAGRGEADGSPA